jgi:hypothetical protein
MLNGPTLNQDLFVERLFLDSTLTLLLPYIDNPLYTPRNINDDEKRSRINYKWHHANCIMPSEKEIEKKIRVCEKKL